jgi:hypothetical protein
VTKVPNERPPGEKGISVVETSSCNGREGTGWLLEGIDRRLIVGKSVNVGRGARMLGGGCGDA